MNITQVRVQLAREQRLRGYCSIVIEGVFVIRDLKIIDGKTGLFVAMPQREIRARCYSCEGKNSLRSKFCGHCGVSLRKPDKDAQQLQADIVHPIHHQGRAALHEAIMREYHAELARSQQPGYVATVLYCQPKGVGIEPAEL